jgi:hypothetical protein
MRVISLFTIAFLFLFTGIDAQTKKNTTKKTVSISKPDFDKLFTYKKNEVLKFTDNKYIDKSILELNSLTGDMQLLRIKLNYFPKAILMIQVNGEYSTQVYITSATKSLSYKAKIEKDRVLLIKCNRDEIVSE